MRVFPHWPTNQAVGSRKPEFCLKGLELGVGAGGRQSCGSDSHAGMHEYVLEFSQGHEGSLVSSLPHLGTLGSDSCFLQRP